MNIDKYYLLNKDKLYIDKDLNLSTNLKLYDLTECMEIYNRAMRLAQSMNVKSPITMHYDDYIYVAQQRQINL